MSATNRGAFRRVYPACAGIDLRLNESPAHGAGLPRMRGDRPTVGSITLMVS